MEPYKLTNAIFNRIMGKREREPCCEVCGKALGEMVGQMIGRNVSRGVMRYYCSNHRIEDRRI